MSITLAELEALDLSYIVEAMCGERYPLPRWQPDAARACEQKYKRFLWLMKCYPEHRLVPSKDVDEFWHNHILYTREYHQDCQRIFGYYLHHVPEGPEHISEDLFARFTETQRLFEITFNDSLLSHLGP